MGFKWDKLVQDTLANMTTRPDWIARYCEWQWDLTPDTSSFRVFMDGRFEYEGASERSGIAEGGHNTTEEKGSVRSMGMVKAIVVFLERPRFGESGRE